MSEELLKIDKLATFDELYFVLLDALDRNDPIEWIELSSICKGRSLNLNRSFDNTIRFLQLLALVDLDEDRKILRLPVLNYQDIKAKYTFCIWITSKLLEKLGQNDLLSTILNIETIKFDINHESFSLNTNLIPFRYPFFKLYLLNMGIARPDSNVRSHIIINTIYKQFFRDMLNKILTPATKLDLHTNETPLPPTSKTEGLKVFISYSHRDEAIKDELTKHFSGLRRNNKITDWNDRMILPGEEWDASIKLALEEADIVIFLISADFIASDYINKVEIGRAVERHNKGLTKLIPILARPCDFANSSLSHIQALPKDAKAITIWEDRDQAFVNIVNEFKRIINF